jgi:perosamine synthetase
LKPVVRYTKPSITALEVAYATDAAQNGWGEHCYDYIDRFEAAFRSLWNVPYAIATSSCTGALHMGLAALGIGAGDEVIIADTNWIASVAPVTYLGATPVMVDILPDTWCLDPAQVEAAITPRTRAIIAVHLYGNLCGLDRLLAIGARHGIPVIEDAAEAVGSMWQGRRAGTLGAFGVFSFHGSKPLTTGEGGMFVTGDAALYEKVLTLSNHGRARGQTKQFWPDVIGFKYKIANIQAAIGCAQLERIDDIVKRKREVFSIYHDALHRLPGICMNPEHPGTVNGYWMPTAVFAPETAINAERVLAAFKTENIDGRVFFHPLSSLPMFSPKPQNVQSYGIQPRAVNLPSYHDLTAAGQQRVIAVIQRLLDQ